MQKLWPDAKKITYWMEKIMRKLRTKNYWNKCNMAEIFSGIGASQKSKKAKSRTKTIIKPSEKIVPRTIQIEKIAASFTIPPSINHCYRSYKGRVIKSKRYTDWQAFHMLQYCNDARQVEGPLMIIITVYLGKGWRTNRDLDNVAKPLLDMLIKIGFIKDDNSKIVRSIFMEVKPQPKNNPAKIELTIQQCL